MRPLTATRTGYLQRQYTVNVAGNATTAQNVQLSTSGKIVGTVSGNGSALSVRPRVRARA